MAAIADPAFPDLPVASETATGNPTKEQFNEMLMGRFSGHAKEKDDRPKLAIRFDQVQDVLGARLAFNELTNQIELDGSVVEDINDLRLTLALEHSISVSQADGETIINRLAKGNAYHPVLRYLEEVSNTHGDDTTIIQGLASRYFGTTESIYEIYLKKMLVAAVARVFEPGCKVDTALILQGPQGLGKSTFFSTLAGSDWFDDSMGAATGERDERLKLHQFWFLEWGELESIFRKKDVASTKAFLSSQVDTVRPPYGRQALTLKRRSVIVGSTNQNDFLTDSTGNRRFWVVPVKKRIDIKTLEAERDRIWAAAVSLYRSGFPWWLTPDEEAIAAEFNEHWQAEDPWTPAIRAYLLDYRDRETTTATILTHVLSIEVGNQTRVHEMRAAEILKGLGWERVQRRDGNRRLKVWVKPEVVTNPPHRLVTEVGDTPKPLQDEGSREWYESPVTNPPLEVGDRLVTGENLTGQGLENLSPTVTNLLPQNTRNFSENSNGKHNPLDISEETLAQLLKGDPHGN
jgi:predicted P-loop ATPase